MKKKILLITGRILNVITVIVTVIFMVINFENITYNTAQSHPEPTMSLNARYQYWFEDIYGEDEGFEICWKIKEHTVWIIEHHINEMLFAVIILMMLGSIWINKKLDKKMNKVLKGYFIFCILLMLWATFAAGPNYVDTIFDA